MNENLKLLLHFNDQADAVLAYVLQFTDATISILDPDGYYLYVNHSVPGFKKEEVIGQPIYNFLPEDLSTQVKNNIKKVINSGESLTYQNEIAETGGISRHYNHTMSPVKTNAGNIQAILIISTEIKNFQEALLSNQHELKVALAYNKAITNAINNSTLVSITDLKGNIIHANDVFCKVSGYSLEDLLGNDHRMINSGYHPTSFWRHLWKTISKGITWRAEVCNRAKDGSIYWVDTVINPIRNEKGKIYQYMSVRNLITERKLSERELLKAYDLLEKTNEAARIGTWEIDLETMQLSWSKVTKGIHEVPDDYQCDIDYAINFYKEGESRETISRLFKACVEKGESYDVELQIISAKGKEKWVRTLGIPVLQGGKYIRCYGTLQDIDESKSAEIEIQKLSLVASKTHNGVVITDAEGQITWVNDAFRRMCGYKLKEAVGKKPGKILQGKNTDPEHAQRVREGIQRKKPFTQEILNYTKQGVPYWNELSITPILNNQGQVVQFIGIQNDITQRKLAEESLQKAYNLLEKSSNAALMGTWEVELNTMQVTLSKVAKQIHGVNDDFQFNLENGIAFYKEGVSRDTITRLFTDCIEKGEKFDIEVQIITAKGKEKWVRTIGIPVIENGKCVRVYGLFQDIDGKTKAIKQLAFQEELFRKTLENTPNGIAMVDMEGNWFKMNISFCNILGYSKEELLALSFLDITPPDDKKLNGALFKEMVAGKQESFQTEKRYIHKNGSIVWATLSVAAVKNDLGQTIHFVYQINDITQKKLAQIQLQEHISRLQSILDASTQVGIIETDANGMINIFNKGAENLIGYTSEEIIHKKTLGIFYLQNEYKKFLVTMPTEITENYEGFALVIRLLEENLFETKEWTFVRKNGSTFPGLLSLTPIRNTKNEISGTLGFITDLTVIKKAEKEIKSLLDVTQAQNQRLLNFAHIISHNLRSHTANISMILDMIQLDDPDTIEKKYFPMLQASSNNLKETISYLNEAVVMNSTTHDNLSTLNLFHYVEKTIADIKALAIDAGCTINNDVSQKLMVKAVPAYLDSIILNLLTNAIKYRSPHRKSEIQIASTLQNKKAQLIVNDNGLGIDLKLHGAKLFGMYKTFHGNKDARGIGLFITKNQIEAMGGSIEVESKVNQGTTFKIYF